MKKRSIERAMDLTDSFTWEDLPTRDAHSGDLTAAGWIPHITMYSGRAAVAIMFPYSTDNNTHRGKSRNNVRCVVSFRMDCFTVL